MTTVVLDAGSLARVRLAVNPALEALSWAVRAVSGRPHPTYGRPGREALECLTTGPAAVLGEIARLGAETGVTPDLVTPSPPRRSHDVLADQLAMIDGVPDDEAAEQLRAAGLASRRVPVALLSALDGGGIGPAVARAVDAFWQLAVAPRWREVEPRLSDEIAMHAAQWARVGLAGFVPSVHPLLDWTVDGLDVGLRTCHDTVELRDQDLVLTPSAFGGDGLMAQLGGPDPWISFPASRETVRFRDRDAAAAMVGRSRARMLELLQVPRSTLEIASITGLSPGTISYHLQVLHRAGAVTRQRSGRYVVYRAIGA